MAEVVFASAINVSLYLPIPLIVWATVRWFRSSRTACLTLKCRLTDTSLILLASSSFAFVLLIAIFHFIPPSSEAARFRLVLRGVQVGFVTGIVGTLLSLFSARTTRGILAVAGLLVSYHWYLLGNGY